MIIRSLGLASSVGYIARLRSLSGGGSEASAELALSPPPGGRLVSASVFFRHGARTPVFTTIPGLSSMGEWDVCTPEAVAVLPEVVVFDLRDGGPRPALSKGVQSQVDFALPTPPGFTAFAGQLSDLGVGQAVNLGRTLRAAYGPHLGNALDDPSTQSGVNEIVKCRTTNVPRCVVSAQGVLHGLFGETARDSAAKAAFPLYTLPTDKEYCTPNAKACPRLGEYFAAGRAEWAQSGGGEAGQSVLKDLKEMLPPEVFDAFTLGDTNFIPCKDLVTSLSAHGKPLPFGLDSRDLPKRLYHLAGLQIGSLLSGGAEAVQDPLAPHRLGLGRLLGETCENLKLDAAAWTTAASASAGAAAAAAAAAASSSKVTATSTVVKAATATSPPPAKLRLVSGHDTTIVPLLAALGCYDGKWPPYASYIALELWAETDPSSGQETFSVRVIYNGAPLQKLRSCNAVDGSGRVPWPEFAALVDSLTPKNMDECEPKTVVKINGDGDKFV